MDSFNSTSLSLVVKEPGAATGAQLFDELAGAYCQPFQTFSKKQERCRAFTRRNLEELLGTRQREKYLQEVRVCVAGLCQADEEEPLEEEIFSQYQFYQAFTETLKFYDDKFDFLIKCIDYGVCRVQPGFEERYTHAMLTVLTFRELQPPPAPEQVLDLRQVQTPRTIGEECVSPEKEAERFVSYRTRRRSFSNDVRAQLAALEEEQAEYEAKKRAEEIAAIEEEHPTEWGERKQEEEIQPTNEKEEEEKEAQQVQEQEQPVASTEQEEEAPKTVVTAPPPEEEEENATAADSETKPAEETQEEAQPKEDPTPILTLLAAVAAQERAATPQKEKRAPAQPAPAAPQSASEEGTAAADENAKTEEEDNTQADNETAASEPSAVAAGNESGEKAPTAGEEA